MRMNAGVPPADIDSFQLMETTIYMKCPVCTAKKAGENEAVINPADFRKYGTFKRKSDSRIIQRFKCNCCNKTYSHALKDPAYNHNKRRLNIALKKLLASNISMRRAAIILGVSRTTIARKLIYLGSLCKKEHESFLLGYDKALERIQFDELQTLEHTKCKPLSVAVAIEPNTRKILGFEVARMPATGHLARISRKKYGIRPDNRRKSLRRLFKQIAHTVSDQTTLISDEHPYYKPIINRLFPYSTYVQHKGNSATVSGQGELKRNARDPLFYINHTLAMLRANINRLIRRTWCTTKCPKRLRDHLNIYMSVHNTLLTA